MRKMLNRLGSWLVKATTVDKGEPGNVPNVPLAPTLHTMLQIIENELLQQATCEAGPNLDKLMTLSSTFDNDPLTQRVLFVKGGKLTIEFVLIPPQNDNTTLNQQMERLRAVTGAQIPVELVGGFDR